MSISPHLRLAANGYADLYALLDSEHPPELDFIKCPLTPDGRSEVHRAHPYHPVLLHGWGPPGYSATAPGIPEPELLSELAPFSGSPCLSIHLDDIPERDGDLSRTELLRRVTANVRALEA